MQGDRESFKDSFHGTDHDPFYYELATYFWQHIALQKLPAEIDAAFLMIEQCAYPWLKIDHTEMLRGVRSHVRRKLGLEAKPGDNFVQWSKKTSNNQVKALSTIVYSHLFGVIDRPSNKTVAEYITALYLHLLI